MTIAIYADVSGLILSSFDSPVWLVCTINILLVINMMGSFQILAQGIFETIESHIKMYLLCRKAEKEGLPADSSKGSISDVLESIIAEVENETGELGDDEEVPRQPPRFADFGNLKSYQKYKMSMGFNKVQTTSIEKGIYNRLSLSMRQPLATMPCPANVNASQRYTTKYEDFQKSRPTFRHSSTFVRLNTGLANEEVPENAEHFLVPAWIRFASRTLYVLFATGLGICLPNFTAFIGFLGAFKCVSSTRIDFYSPSMTIYSCACCAVSFC